MQRYPKMLYRDDKCEGATKCLVGDVYWAIADNEAEEQAMLEYGFRHTKIKQKAEPKAAKPVPEKQPPAAAPSERQTGDVVVQLKPKKGRKAQPKAAA